MPYHLYSKTNQRILEAGFVAASFYLAFLIRFEGSIPPYHMRQFSLLVVPVVIGQLLTNSIFGLNKNQWPCVRIGEILFVVLEYVSFCVLRRVLAFALPVPAGSLPLPANLIVIHLLLSVISGL